MENNIQISNTRKTNLYEMVYKFSEQAFDI